MSLLSSLMATIKIDLHDNDTIIALPCDASTRRYYRIKNDHRLIMVAPPSEKPEEFIKIAQYLRNLGLAAPCVYEQNAALDSYVIEDFGNLSFHSAIKENPSLAPSLYEGAVDVLLHLHKNAQKTDCIKDYTHEILLREAKVFLQWYVDDAFHVTCPTAGEEFETLISNLLGTLPPPSTFVLRDYHIDNIMLRDGFHGLDYFGLIDFQDGLWGHTGYDLVSLIYDARIDVCPLLRKKLIHQYLAFFPTDQHQDIKKTMLILNTSRQLKILGIFKRLYLRDHKPHYLSHIPRVEGYLRECLQDPLLAPLLHWMKKYDVSAFI